MPSEDEDDDAVVGLRHMPKISFGGLISNLRDEVQEMGQFDRVDEVEGTRGGTVVMVLGRSVTVAGMAGGRRKSIGSLADTTRVRGLRLSPFPSSRFSQLGCGSAQLKQLRRRGTGPMLAGSDG